jgi:transcriptional regulator with XRE-family HTH domain
MKFSAALRKVLKFLRIPQARLCKESGISSSNLSRIITEVNRDIGMANVQKIADGLEKIDPVAKPLFYLLLSMPDDIYATSYVVDIEAHEHPDVIEQFIKLFIDEGLTTPEAVRTKQEQLDIRGSGLTVAEWLSIRLQNKRLQSGGT